MILIRDKRDVGNDKKTTGRKITVGECHQEFFARNLFVSDQIPLAGPYIEHRAIILDVEAYRQINPSTAFFVIQNTEKLFFLVILLECSLISAFRPNIKECEFCRLCGSSSMFEALFVMRSGFSLPGMPDNRFWVKPKFFGLTMERP